MKIVMYAVVLVLMPLACLGKIYPDANLWPFMFMLWGAVIFVFMIQRRDATRDYNMLMQDAEAFGMVVRQFWRDEPLLATALWKKVHPNCPPPWHQPPEQEG